MPLGRTPLRALLKKARAQVRATLRTNAPSAGYLWPVPPYTVLVVGQTPPPFGGQAVMIQELLNAPLQAVRLHHVRMAFSTDMASMGRFSVKKVLVLASTIARIAVARLRTGARVLYYPPSGPEKVPVMRDIVLLCAVRWMFARTVFHFHAGGVSTYRQQLPALLRPLFDLAYGRPAAAIRTSHLNPDDGATFGAGMNVVVPNGVPNMATSVPPPAAAPGPPTVLFTGVLIPSKGVLVLLRALAVLRERGVPVVGEFMGHWGDAQFQRACQDFVREQGLEEQVDFLGVLTGQAKYERFAACTVFCFPSFFPSESFGLVLLEAMQFAKPVVSTRWRGIPDVVADGESGYLVPIEDHLAVADKLQALLSDDVLRQRMGLQGKRIFSERFTLEAFHSRMEKLLVDVAKGI
jgi:glycosyltransferase involved in cell wall biosynthesis